jgi:hypothetical protein
MTITLNGTAGVTFPAGGLGNPAGAVVGTTDTQTLTNKTLGSGLVAGASLITSGTAVASTSGTSIDFTSIPTWVKRVTVMFNGVSTNGTSGFLIQLGDAGGVETTGYISGSTAIGNGVVGSLVTSTAGYVIATGFTAANTFHGVVTIATLGTNIWAAGGSTYQSSASTYVVAGSKTLSDTLDRVRITTVGGTDTFDAGSINILYE